MVKIHGFSFRVKRKKLKRSLKLSRGGVPMFFRRKIGIPPLESLSLFFKKIKMFFVLGRKTRVFWPFLKPCSEKAYKFIIWACSWKKWIFVSILNDLFDCTPSSQFSVSLKHNWLLSQVWDSTLVQGQPNQCRRTGPFPGPCNIRLHPGHFAAADIILLKLKLWLPLYYKALLLETLLTRSINQGSGLRF